MKVKVAEATGAALDHMVGIAMKLPAPYWNNGRCAAFSTDWAQGGPIIDRIEGFHLKVWLKSNREGKCQVEIHNCDGDWIQFGSTPLIAAMRCYVMSQLGDEVEVPDGLS